MYFNSPFVTKSPKPASKPSKPPTVSKSSPKTTAPPPSPSSTTPPTTPSTSSILKSKLRSVVPVTTPSTPPEAKAYSSPVATATIPSQVETVTIGLSAIQARINFLGVEVTTSSTSTHKIQSLKVAKDKILP